MATVGPDPHAEYTSRVVRWNDEIARGERNFFRVSNLRLTVVVIAVAAMLPTIRGYMSTWWYALFAAAFVALVIIHARVSDGIDHAKRVRRIYERGLARLEGRWMNSGPTGARFLREDHPFARDLDLFGDASLFQLLDIARTDGGEDTLAAWLLDGASPEEVRARQQAVDELRSLVDYREALAIAAAGTRVGRTGAIAEWAAATPAGLPPGLAVALTPVAVVTGALILAVVTTLVSWHALLWWGLVPGILALVWRAKVRVVLGRVEMAGHDLDLLSTLLEIVESRQFVSPRLDALRQALYTEGVPPSRRIASLRRSIGWLDSTANQIFLPIARLLALRTMLAVLIDRWHARFGGAVREWIRVVGELEALSALATHAYEHPTDPFPQVEDEGCVFEADGLGHPLLLASSTVRNDVHLGGSGPRVLIVSGSNMSGKSTLLRAVGVNAVLALAGAPVRAAHLRLSPLALGATLRIEDSLQEGRSRFYAEILRLRAIVEIARGRDAAAVPARRDPRRDELATIGGSAPRRS